MFKFPIQYFEQNLIFNANNECWACYKLKNFNYDFKSTERKIAILNSLARFISNIGTEGKILIIPVCQDVNTHFDYLIAKLDDTDELYDAVKAHAEGTCQHINQKIEQSGNVNDYVTYVVTRLDLSDDILKNIKDAWSYFVKEPKQAIYEYFSVSTKDILARKIKIYKNLANEFLKTQTRRIEIEEVSAVDLQWLYRRMFFRGLNEEIQLRYNIGEDFEQTPWTPFVELVKSPSGEDMVRPYKKDILTLSSGIVDTSESRTLKVVHHDRTSYQAFLPVTHIPDGMEFPGNEWLLFLQEMPFETEVCIHVENVEHKKSIKKIEEKRKTITSQIQHIEKNNEDIPDDLLYGKDYADQLEAELKASKSPLSRATITFCIAADDKATLEERVKTVRSDYKDSNFVVERPLADQEKLFMEFIPGAGRYMKDYIMPLPPRTLAGGIFGATTFLGDTEGAYIGTVGTLKRNVYLDILLACARDRSASVFSWGDLGFGKSFNMNLLFYLAIMYNGAKGLVIDPKGERTKWLYKLPELEGKISVTTLAAGDDDRGKLDPFSMYRENVEEAGELALSILAELFKLHPKDDEYLTIMESINYVKGTRNPCMLGLAERLNNFPENDEFRTVARKVGRRINLLREMGMSGLLFGDGTESGLNFKNRVNILQVQNMKLPKGDIPKDEYTPEQTLSTVLMLPISSFAKKFALSDNSLPKINLLDESWSMTVTQQGSQLFEFLSRTGRSLKTGNIFIGHSTRDIDFNKGIRNALSYKFCFHITDVEEIKRSLEFMELEVTDENIEKIQKLSHGECMFRDLDGRVGKLSFDYVYGHLFEAFKTTPPPKKKGVKDGVA